MSMPNKGSGIVRTKTLTFCVHLGKAYKEADLSNDLLDMIYALREGDVKRFDIQVYDGEKLKERLSFDVS